MHYQLPMNQFPDAWPTFQMYTRNAQPCPVHQLSDAWSTKFRTVKTDMIRSLFHGYFESKATLFTIFQLINYSNWQYWHKYYICLWIFEDITTILQTASSLRLASPPSWLILFWSDSHLWWQINHYIHATKSNKQIQVSTHRKLFPLVVDWTHRLLWKGHILLIKMVRRLESTHPSIVHCLAAHVGSVKPGCKHDLLRGDFRSRGQQGDS